MLGIQALCQLALSFSLRSRSPSDLQGRDVITNGLMALAVAILLLYLIFQVQKAQVELKVTILRWYCSTAITHDPPNFHANKFLTSSIASALILILATSIHHATTYSSHTLVQDFYLLPQVIAKILCNVHGGPLSPSILMPTFAQVVTNLVNAVFPDQNFFRNCCDFLIGLLRPLGKSSMCVCYGHHCTCATALQWTNCSAILQETCRKILQMKYHTIGFLQKMASLSGFNRPSQNAWSIWDKLLENMILDIISIIFQSIMLY
jgi:hypothetical protein